MSLNMNIAYHIMQKRKKNDFELQQLKFVENVFKWTNINEEVGTCAKQEHSTGNQVFTNELCW